MAVYRHWLENGGFPPNFLGLEAFLLEYAPNIDQVLK